MKICYDVDVDSKTGYVITHHIFTTDKAEWNKAQHPTDATKTLDAIDFLVLASKDQELAEKSGWNIVSKHPNHFGKTRMQAVIDSIHSGGTVEEQALFA